MKSSFRSIAHSIGLLVGCSIAMGCAIDTSVDESVTEPDGKLGKTTQAWSVVNHGTTNDLIGVPIEPQVGHTCWLSGVTGDLSKGRQWEPLAVQSTAHVHVPLGGNQWTLFAHGGAWQNQFNDRVWANNPVFASAVCVQKSTSAGGKWKGRPTTVTPPQWITGLGPGGTFSFLRRQCFLSGVVGGDGFWTQPYNYARVVRVGANETNPAHPTPGWYVEANMLSTVNGDAYVFASCVDINFAAPRFEAQVIGPSAVPLTNGPGIKNCGLTQIKGAFNKNDWSDGATLASPSTQNGQWTLHVSVGKVADAVCYE